MNSTRRTFLSRLAGPAPVICFANTFGLAASGQESTSDTPDWTTECRRNLNIVYEAIQAYRRQNDNRLPPTLTDLHPKYISDKNLLCCPIALATGDFRLGVEGFRDSFDIDRLPSYNYEFTNADEDSWLTGKPLGTKAEYKKLQMKTPVGKMVPLVRCLNHLAEYEGDVHRTAINLAYNGKIYPSHEFWESSFVDLIPQIYLMPDYVWEDTRPIVERIPARANGLATEMIDLTEAYNGLLKDSWSRGTKPYHLKEFEASMSADRVYSAKSKIGENIDFDCRGVVQLDAKLMPSRKEGFRAPTYPKKSKEIRIGKKCRKIHLLAGCLYPSAKKVTVATLQLSLGGGKKKNLNLVYGENIVQWFYPEKQAAAAGHGADIVWTGKNPLSDSTGQNARLCLASFDLEPGTFVESAVFHTGMEVPPPFIVGLTIASD